jgi:hypothetical protein
MYAQEILPIFNQCQYTCKNKSEADYFITCLSDELNYPVYGNMDYARSKNWMDNVSMSNLLNKYAELTLSKKIVAFCHVPIAINKNNIILMCYSKKDEDKQNIVICPPAIKKYNFNNNFDKKYFISFKGNIHASENRKKIFYSFQKYNNEKNIIIEKTNNSYNYDDLINNSLFSIIIEGDLPWSYRLTEAINAGSIPIIVKPKNHNIFGFDELIDYSLFSIVIDEDNIDHLVNYTLPNLSNEIIKNMLYNLEKVNNEYFISREQQMKGVLEILQKRLNL